MPAHITNNNDIATLIATLRAGNRRALARLLTLATTNADAVQHALKSATTSAAPNQPTTPVIAFTGSGGVGKSSLLGSVVTHFANQGERVAVLACDPESPITGGALLGDRCRIAANNPTASAVFIRSVATPPGGQGLAPNVHVMLDLLRAFGFDRIFLETVGAGQADVAVRDAADLVVLILQPQTGDTLQWEKAGVLEIADIVVINKSDLPGADQTTADIREQLHSARDAAKVVVQTSVARNTGIELLCDALRTSRSGGISANSENV